MGFTALVDVAIGLALLYLGASLFVTVANEYIGQLTELRAVHLEAALKRLLKDDGLTALLKTPLLQTEDKTAGSKGWLSGLLCWILRIEDPGLQKRLINADGKRVTYVDPKVIAQAMIGLLKTAPADASAAPTPAPPSTPSPTSTPAPTPTPASLMSPLVSTIKSMDDSQVKNVLVAISKSSATVQGFAADVEQWVDRQLKVLGESYKKSVQRISFMLGLLIAVGFNIDTLDVTERLYRDKELRERIALAAEQYAKPESSPQFKKCREMKLEEQQTAEACKPYKALLEDLSKGGGVFAGLPIGWTSWKELADRALPHLDYKNLEWIGNLLRHWIGWLLTALAISIGAPFWFDFLNRLVNVRHGIRRPEPEATK